MAEPPGRRDKCCDGDDCGPQLDRRDFVKTAGLGLGGLTTIGGLLGTRADVEAAQRATRGERDRPLLDDAEWPSLRVYEAPFLDRVAMPIGGIGTGTVSLGGRGDLRDWEIMNRPAKGFIPRLGNAQTVGPFLALFARAAGGTPVTRLLEGPSPLGGIEGSHGATTPNEHLPRFTSARFATSYPFARVLLSDADVPLEVELRAFNPLVPPDADASGIPLAAFTVVLANRGRAPVTASAAMSVPNFIGIDGSTTQTDWKHDAWPVGARRNRNTARAGSGLQGLFLSSDGVDLSNAAWGTLALATTAVAGVTTRTSWASGGWGSALLDFWDDFAADGRLEPRTAARPIDAPMASLAIAVEIPPGETREIPLLLSWHFPNRYTWRPRSEPPGPDDRVGNYYASRYRDAWEVLEKETPRLEDLRRRTARFVREFTDSELPAPVKEAALFNLSTLRTQTCFRTADGRFYGFEGSNNRSGCCWGSCTHVWNYEQATPFLFGALAWTMREVEYAHATDAEGLMSFRVTLPLDRAREFGKAAADGQMGCVMKAYRDWQLSGDDAALRELWPAIRRSIEFCWIPGGWDADRDGVMEGAQHNTMDVEYYGPNPQMGIWYLGALRAAEEMARRLGDTTFAGTCRGLFDRGSAWLDANLFNGEYYEHRVQPPPGPEAVAPSLLVGMGAEDVTNPDYQLGRGCLVDQLVGQYMAHVVGLGYLVNADHVKTTLASIRKYNRRADLATHFNPLRSFALAGEAALLMASYPHERPANPFPYYGEVMTGFEYTAAVGMLYEGMTKEGLESIVDIRTRYDGRKRNPFDEAECGHHYARAMASWAAVLALTGFHYSAVTREMTFGPKAGRHFWSNGYAWGRCTLAGDARKGWTVTLSVAEGEVTLASVAVGDHRSDVSPPRRLAAGESVSIELRPA
jgi:non-lysosomal glucosylceramidase